MPVIDRELTGHFSVRGGPTFTAAVVKCHVSLVTSSKERTRPCRESSMAQERRFGRSIRHPGRRHALRRCTLRAAYSFVEVPTAVLSVPKQLMTWGHPTVSSAGESSTHLHPTEEHMTALWQCEPAVELPLLADGSPRPRLCENSYAGLFCMISGVLRPLPDLKSTKTGHSERSIFFDANSFRVFTQPRPKADVHDRRLSGDPLE